MPVHSGRLSGDKTTLSTRHKSDRLHLIGASWLPHFLRVVVAKYRGHRGQTGKVRLTLCQRCIFLAPLEQGPALHPQGPPGPNGSGKVRGSQANSCARSRAMLQLAGVVHLRQQVGPQFGPCRDGGQGLPLAPAFGRRSTRSAGLWRPAPPGRGPGLCTLASMVLPTSACGPAVLAPGGRLHQVEGGAVCPLASVVLPTSDCGSTQISRPPVPIDSGKVR